MLNELFYTDNQGTIQSERGLPALNSEHFSVEERNLEYWLVYLRKLAKQIHFFQTGTDEINGNWEEAFLTPENLPYLLDYVQGKTIQPEKLDLVKKWASRPDMALMLSFLKILENPLRQFQNLTESHKQFYYRTVLGLQEKSAVPDRCNLVITLHEDTSSMTLKENVEFDGGKDSDGNSLIYRSIGNNVINQAVVAKAYSMSNFGDKLENHKSNFLVTDLVDLEQALEFPELGAMTFGEDQAQKFENAERQRYPELGFIISSPLLWLEGGERTIEISFDEDDIEETILNSFEIYLSTVEGWSYLEVKDLGKDTLSETHGTVSKNTIKGIKISLTSLFPSVTATTEGESPILLFRVREENGGSYYYKDLKNLRLSQIDLKINVKQLKQMKINNQETLVDITKPFSLFGDHPRVKSRFHLTHPELLVKEVMNVELKMEWLDLPSKFSDHYQTYSYYRYENTSSTDQLESNYVSREGNDCSDLKGVSDINFHSHQKCMLWPKSKVKVQASYLLDTSSKPVELFEENGEGENLEGSTLNLENKNFSGLESIQYSDLPIDEPDPLEWPRWLSFELKNNDFGHQDYTGVAEYFAYLNAGIISSQSSDPIVQVPEPYTPTLNNIELSYESSVKIIVGESGSDQPHQLQLVHPSGKQDLDDSNVKGVVPHFSYDGYLYLGLQNMTIPGQVNLFFQVEPIDNSNISQDSQLRWTYLDNNQWIKFLEEKQDAGSQLGLIAEDSTNGLLDSGIIKFSFPEMENPKNNFMGQGLVWIRAALVNDSNDGKIPFYSFLRGIYAQGIQVTGTVETAEPLPEESIKELIEEDLRIDAIEQPYPSFGGKRAEDSQAFAIRSSEELRHKGRALSAWDYEHLVLSQFSELYLARCVRRQEEITVPTDPEEPASLTETETSYKIVPYGVDVVVIPKTFDPDMLQPKVPLFLKKQIESYVKEISPHNADVNIVDPIYESVYFDIRLSLYLGFDPGSELLNLNSLLVKALTPWNVTNQSDLSTAESSTEKAVKIGNPITLTAVVAFLESQPSVDNVLGVKAYQIREDGGLNHYTGNLIEPSTPHAIIVPGRNQEIRIFEESGGVYGGIGVMEVEYDFLVS